MNYKFFFLFEEIGFFNLFNTQLPIRFEFIFGNISFILLFSAVLLYWFDFYDAKTKSKKIKNFCMIGANLSLTNLLIVRWWESGHFPLSNLYESLIGLSWSLTVVHLIVIFYFTKNLDETIQKQNDKIGAITAPTALLTSVFATFFLPTEMLRATTLIPALKSNWLTMHVTVMLLSYAFLLIGSLLSVALCAYKFSTNFFKFSFNNSQNINYEYCYQDSLTPKAILSAEKLNNSFSYNSNLVNQLNEKNLQKDQKFQLDVCIWLNTMSYRILGLGFPLLTIGILSGAVWANEAWGSYWSWDPKETWALITWLVFAIYFHSRYNRSSDVSLVPASIASFGFVMVWICYLGVNLLQTGLHSYGWFS